MTKATESEPVSTVITVRLTEDEKKELESYGKISDVVRDALRLYIKKRKTDRLFKELEEFQKKHRIKISRDEIVSTIREDRNSR
jgi:Arc/MetJ-type ribon-helix-helix transcriptional regulator